MNKPYFPVGTFLWLDSENLPINDDPELDGRASANFSAFQFPQLILKQSWRKENGRFQAVLIKSNDCTGVLCSESYITEHTSDVHLLETACLSYNSKLAVYYLLLSSGRFFSYRPEPNGEDLLRVPIPEHREGMIQNLETFDAIDYQVYDAFSLKESERVLIEDVFNYTLPDFQGDITSP